MEFQNRTRPGATDTRAVLASLNVQRAGQARDRSYALLRALGSQQYRWDFLGLQEAQCLEFEASWFPNFGFHHYASADGKSAILFRRADSVRGQWNGNRWCAILIGKLLFTSVYLPDSSVPDFECIVDVTLRAVTLMRQYVSRKFGDCMFAVASDVNVELTAWVEYEGMRFTGGGVEPKVIRGKGSQEIKRREQELILRDRVEGWLQEEKLMASNTFGPRCITWYPYNLEARQQVLDYVFVPVDSNLVTVDVDTLHWGPTSRLAGVRLSDHALVRVEVLFPAKVLARRFLSRRARSLKFWEPVDHSELDSYRRLVDVSASSCTSCAQLEGQVYASAAATECIPKVPLPAPRRPEELVLLDREYFRRRIREKGTEPFKILCRDRNRLQRSFRRARLEWEMESAARRRRPLPHVMIGGERVVDRTRWVSAVKEVGRRCTDEEERKRSTQILEDLRQQTQGSVVPPEALLTMPLLLRARARLRVGKATGPDGMSAAVIRQLPWRALRVVLRCFNEVLTGAQLPPQSWCATMTSLMPKSLFDCSVGDTRRLAVESVWKKWYSTTVLLAMEPFTAKIRSQVSLFGFVPGRSCSEVTAALKRAAQHAALWGKDRKLLIASADVKQAFQHTTVACVKRAMDVLAIPCYLQYAILVPLLNEETTLLFEGVAVEHVRVDRHIRTGGNESPELWNLVVCAMWSALFHSWDEQGTGFHCYHPSDREYSLERTAVVNHLLYADNVYILGSDLATFQEQLTSLTSILRDWGFEWKADSLEYAAVGFDCELPVISVVIEDTYVPLRAVDRLNVLGNDVLISYRERHADLVARIGKARGAFFKRSVYFRTRAVLWKQKCRRYVSLVQSVLLFGAETFSWDADSLHRLNVFEGQCLYRMAGSRKPPDRSWGEWKPTQLDLVRKKFLAAGFRPAVQIVLSRLWDVGRDVASFFSSAWDPAYVRTTPIGTTLNADGEARPIAPPSGGHSPQSYGTSVSPGPAAHSSGLDGVPASVGIPGGGGKPHATGFAPGGAVRVGTARRCAVSDPRTVAPRASDSVGIPGGGGKPHVEAPSSTGSPPAGGCAPLAKRRRILCPPPGMQIAASSRAHQDARRLLMCATPRWDSFRTRASEYLRRLGRWREASTLKRRFQGGAATGEHAWSHMFEVIYGEEWWKVCDFSHDSLASCTRDFLAHCGLTSVLDYFVRKSPGGGGREREDSKRSCMEEVEALAFGCTEKAQRRLAAINDRATVWAEGEDGIGLEMIGDSLLVCNWADGVWRVGFGQNGNGFRYQSRVDALISCLDHLSSQGVRTSSWGADFVKHEYREGNERADRLTHRAREGDCFRWLDLFSNGCYPPEDWFDYKVIGLRGKFDGGVDATGVGIGWWLQVGLSHVSPEPLPPLHAHLSKRQRVEYSAYSPPPPLSITWRDVGECAAILPPHCTITDAELSALEGLLEAAAEVVQSLGPYRGPPGC